MSYLSCLKSVKRTAENTRPLVSPWKCDISFVIDRSGSMESMKKETINGTINFVDEQKKVSKETGTPTYLTIKTFDDKVETIPGFDSTNIFQVPEIDTSYLNPRNTTRLIDTAYETIQEQQERLSNYYSEMPYEIKKLNPQIVLIFALITDGQDNCSYRTGAELNQLLTSVQKNGCKCLFLAANQDAISQGSMYGFNKDNAMTYTSSGSHSSSAMRAVSNNISRIASGSQSSNFTNEERTQSYNPDDYQPNIQNYTTLKRCPAVMPVV